MAEHRFENGILTIVCPENVNSGNAGEWSKELRALLEEYAPAKVVFDAAAMNYISSMGLRAILDIKKKCEECSVVNASLEIYDIFDMTGFTDILDVKKRLREVSIEGCKLIGAGRNGEVYRLSPDTIIKVYNPKNSMEDIEHERELAKLAFVTGIPTALSFDIVKVGDKTGTLYELLDAKSMAGRMAESEADFDKELERFTDLMKEIHSLTIDKKLLTNKKSEAKRWLRDIENQLDEDVREKLYQLIEEIPESDHIVHGDFHMGNIMEVGDELNVIDMDTLGYGDSIFELANLHFTLVGFLVISPEDDLLEFGYERYLYVWDRIIERYYAELSEQEKAEKLRKIETLSYIRLYRYCLRHENASHAAAEIKRRLIERVQ